MALRRSICRPLVWCTLD